MSPERGGPICPDCRHSLRENLVHEQIESTGASAGGARPRVEIFYCGSCGRTLHAGPSAPFDPAASPRGAPVATPADGTALEGRFQDRCRELIGQIRSLGFDPFVWVGLINEMGAVTAAKAILADYGVLPVTRWLVDQGHPELTLEGEIQQARWADLFDEGDRGTAVRRLASTEG